MTSSVVDAKNKIEENNLFDGDGTFEGIEIKPIVMGKTDFNFVNISKNNTNTEAYDYISNNSTPDVSFDETTENEKNKQENDYIQNEIKMVSLDGDNKLKEIKTNQIDYFELYENFIKYLLKPNPTKRNSTSSAGDFSNYIITNSNIINNQNPTIQNIQNDDSTNSQNIILDNYNISIKNLINGINITNNSNNNLILNINYNGFEYIPKKFGFRREHIIALVKACQDVVASQPIVLKLTTPIKVFGDLHGQYDDLMRFFELWGEPSENFLKGDINSLDYLFLGDYVDRGNYSLEIICLLMALKIKYPEKIHLLRGNHEDRAINCNFGFYDECQMRLSCDSMGDELNVFRVINDFFDYLPLVAIIEDEIVCVHGGIGRSFDNISDVEKMKRPIRVVHEAQTKQEQIVMDILWSDPTDDDSQTGIQANPNRDIKSCGNIVKFGPDIVKNFLEKNKKHLIIRAHECVQDGIERFCAGNLITIFSATDYCGKYHNSGCMLEITNNFRIIPFLIQPNDINTNVNWMTNESFLKKRPPTPPKKDKKNIEEN